MVLLLLAILAITVPRRSFREYCLIPVNSMFVIKWGFAFFAVFVVLAVTLIGVLAVLGDTAPGRLSMRSLLGSFVQALVFTGFVEEALFRGYVQKRQEQVYGKQWNRLVFKPWRVRYGYGLFIASMIFGVVHILNYWNPFVPRGEITPFTPVHIIMACGVGVLLGALREASGDIYVSVFLHGGLNTAINVLLATTNIVLLNVVLITGLFLFFYMLDKYFDEATRTVHGGDGILLL